MELGRRFHRCGAGEQMIWVESSPGIATSLRVYGLAGEVASIGRGYDNDVILDDPYVARRHLRYSRDEAGQLVAEDLGSINGTFLDGSTSRALRASLSTATAAADRPNAVACPRA